MQHKRIVRGQHLARRGAWVGVGWGDESWLVLAYREVRRHAGRQANDTHTHTQTHRQTHTHKLALSAPTCCSSTDTRRSSSVTWRALRLSHARSFHLLAHTRHTDLGGRGEGGVGVGAWAGCRGGARIADVIAHCAGVTACLEQLKSAPPVDAGESCQGGPLKA